MATKEARVRATHIARQAWSRRIAAMLMCVSVAFLSFTLLHRGQGAAGRRIGSAHDSEMRQLGALLETVRACVAPAQRAAALERARQRLEALEGTMSLVLAQPAHPWFRDAATAAAELRFEDLLPTLRSALTIARGSALAVAWTAVDTLQPIDEAEIAALMESAERELQQAGLRIAQERAPLPESLVAAALSCVGSDDHEVRNRAIACLPEELDPAHTDTVLDLCDENPSDVAVSALLGRLPPSERGLGALLARVQGADAQAVLRLQPALRRYADADAVRKALWEAAADLDDVERGTRALHCLEIAGARDPAPPGSASWPLRLQYFLARIRVADHDLSGIDSLLRIAETGDESESKDPETVGEARLALASLAHMPPHATLEEIRAWRQALAAVPDEPLPAPSR